MNLFDRRRFLKGTLAAGGLMILPSPLKCFSNLITPEGKEFDLKMVPEPILEDDIELIELYNKAWELAYKHIKYQSGLPQSPYMDEAFDDSTIWIWDTCFMVHFCKYAPQVFPGIQSLNNFYVPLHDHEEISLRICIPDNPPLFAWTEYEYFKLTGNKDHLKSLLYDKQYLQKHFDWFNKIKPNAVIAHSAPVCLEKRELGYKWEGGRSGMDNTPRGRKGVSAAEERPNNPDMLWIDAIAQQGLSALYISRLFERMNDKKNAIIWKRHYRKIKDLVNRYYWNEKDGIYYDINEKTLAPIKVITPASFWPMFAEMCNKQQAEKLVMHLRNNNELGGVVPWVSLAREDADFHSDGHYWRGSVWLPTAYMGIKALEKYGYHKLAYDSASQIVNHMLETYKNYSPHTIWECYNPNEPKPAQTANGEETVRPDFCGWSALGPISLLIENILGFYNIDSDQKIVSWSLNRKDRHGIKNLRFGNIATDIVYSDNSITIQSNEAYTLKINDKPYPINPGKQSFKL
ncbi:MAG: trehalase family glycosidase [Bacteroidota bacterium]|nr:trehalase family glycosidase [Bacteroidota bacterium]